MRVANGKEENAKKRGNAKSTNKSRKRAVEAAPKKVASTKEEKALAAQPPKPKKIYKYIGPDNLSKIFHSADVTTLKCSLPKEFNDPYELFLTIDFNERPDALAFYADAIGELPQLPTTCFSRSPIVLPMWAHYAQNLEGFALEFLEDRLDKAFPQSRLDDVSYTDVPSKDLTTMLYRAHLIGKHRYTYFLQRMVFQAAYFTKASCWSYEQERRMVVQSGTRQADALTLLDVPIGCINSIICGPRASEQSKKTLFKKAEEIGCQSLELRIGKSSTIPYFVNADGEPFSFDQTEIVPNEQSRETCQEPLAEPTGQCSWCQIDDELRQLAASRNPFWILAHAGLLESYIEGMDAVGARKTE